MTNKTKPKMPAWKNSDKTIARFWDTHDIADYWDELEVADDVKFVKPKKKTISVRLEPIYLRQLKVLARKMGVGYSSLVRLWVVDKLHHLLGKTKIK